MAPKPKTTMELIEEEMEKLHRFIQDTEPEIEPMMQAHKKRTALLWKTGKGHISSSGGSELVIGTTPTNNFF